jgi:predicted nucleic acid-binding protein
MANKYNLREIRELRDRYVFVDANVLIYLFWSTGSAFWEINYASVYSALLKQRNQLCVDFLVISEFVNRVLRTEHKKKQPDSNFKQFRDSRDGKDVLSDIYSLAQTQILDQFEVVGKSFSKDDIIHFLSVNGLDFLDKGILKICRNNNFVLLTNDKDFKNADIDILTCNHLILSNQ